MRRLVPLFVLSGLLTFGCVTPDPSPRFTPAWEEVDTSGEGWHATRRALLCADCQFHNLYSTALPERNLSAEALAATAIRPPQLDLFSGEVLKWILETDGPKSDVILHLGDAANLAIADGHLRLVGPDRLTVPRPRQDNHDVVVRGELGQLNEQVGDALTAFTAPPPEADETAAGFGSAEEIFAAMPGAFNEAAAGGVDVVFQYNISGKLGGDWSCAIKDNACTVTAGNHDAPICTLKMGDTDFLAMMSGTLGAMQAYTSGKLKIEGDIMKSQLIEKLFKF